MTGVSEGRPALEKELSEVTAELLGLAAKLSELRREAASRLEEEAGRHLGELAFNDCGFEVRLSRSESPNRNGADNAEFLVRLNPGMLSNAIARHRFRWRIVKNHAGYQKRRFGLARYRHTGIR